MSALFFKQFLKHPFQIASIVASSKAGGQQDGFQSTAVVVIDTVEFTPEEAAQEIILHLKHESFIGLSEKAA